MVRGTHGWRTLLTVTLGLVGTIGPATAARAAATVPAPSAPRLVLVVPPLVAVRSGGHIVVHEALWNIGTAPESEPVTLSMSVPPGVYVGGPLAKCTPEPFAHTALCHFPAGLKPGHADRVDITVTTATGMNPAVLSGTASGGTDTTPAWGSPARFLLVVLP